MALTTTEKNDTLYYLGWPLKTLVTGSTHYHNTIAKRLDDLNTDIEAIMRRLLRELKDMDSELKEARCRLTASKVDDITLNENEISQRLRERRRIRNELSATIDIPVIDDGPNISVMA